MELWRVLASGEVEERIVAQPANLTKRTLAGPGTLKNAGGPSYGRFSREPTQPLPLAVDEGDDVGPLDRGEDLGECSLACHHAPVPQAGADASRLIACHSHLFDDGSVPRSQAPNYWSK